MPETGGFKDEEIQTLQYVLVFGSICLKGFQEFLNDSFKKLQLGRGKLLTILVFFYFFDSDLFHTFTSVVCWFILTSFCVDVLAFFFFLSSCIFRCGRVFKWRRLESSWPRLLHILFIKMSWHWICPRQFPLWMIKIPDAREVIKLQHMHGIKRPVVSGVLQWRT